MNPPAKQPWESLFPAPRDTDAVIIRRQRLLRRRGQPLLLLPEAAAAARTALALYPAQSRKARLARSLLRLAQSPSTRLRGEPIDLRLRRDDPFTRFLLTSESELNSASLALLLGNPNVAGRRFIALVLDAAGQPLRLVKAGVGAEARRLIAHEAAMLRQVTALKLPAPKLLGELDSGEQSALALDYVAGEPPGAAESSRALELLTGWVDARQTVTFAELRVARALRENCPAGDASLLDRLEHLRFAPTLWHGDFAPWNIRVRPDTNAWVVLDWERSQLTGPPAWDWFHFIVQPEILVRRTRPEGVLRRLLELRQGADFARYAGATGISENFFELLAGYLLVCRDVVHQTEGREAVGALLERVRGELRYLPSNKPA